VRVWVRAKKCWKKIEGSILECVWFFFFFFFSVQKKYAAKTATPRQTLCVKVRKRAELRRDSVGNLRGWVGVDEQSTRWEKAEKKTAKNSPPHKNIKACVCVRPSILRSGVGERWGASKKDAVQKRGGENSSTSSGKRFGSGGGRILDGGAKRNWKINVCQKWCCAHVVGWGCCCANHLWCCCYVCVEIFDDRRLW
jgi:uncharacterized membrane protein YgcG